MPNFDLPDNPSIMPILMTRSRVRAWSVAAALLLCVIGGRATAGPLAGEERFTQRIGQIISADLQRSGLFKLGSVGSVRPLPAEPAEINYRYWKNEGTETMVIGSVIERANGSAEVRFR